MCEEMGGGGGVHHETSMKVGESYAQVTHLGIELWTLLCAV